MASDSAPTVTPLYPEALVKAPPSVPGVRVIENAHVAMRDGVLLAVDIYLPQAEGRYPALAIFAPPPRRLSRPMDC